VDHLYENIDGLLSTQKTCDLNKFYFVY